MVKTRLSMLRGWRRVVKEVVKVVKEIYPSAEIYLAGGAAEDRLTALSDIDILVVFKERREERAEILAKIWEKLENTFPLYYPLEIHILDSHELEKIRGKKVKLSSY